MFNEDEEESSDNEQTKCCAKVPLQNKRKQKQKPGRKATWSDSLVDDLVDIVVNNEYYKKRLIFMNMKNQKNAEIYEKILKELRARAAKREEDVLFTAVQLRTKFKKLIGECKKIALTVKSATGIKRLQDEKGYGPWFNQLFSLVKTRDSCQPWQAIELSIFSEASPEVLENGSTSISLSESSHPQCEKEKAFFVPVKNASRKRKAEDNVKEILEAVKKIAEKDPMKDYIDFLREDAERSRQHEERMMELLLKSPMQTNVYQQQPMPSPLSYGIHFQTGGQENTINGVDGTFFKL